MKHQTPTSLKFKKLARRLGLRVYEAVGVLEMLWIVTQREAPRGDVGKLDNEELAIELDWPGDADELVEALVATGWLDVCPQHRLVVHGWAEHAPRYVHGIVARKGGFACPTPEQPREPTTVADCSWLLQSATNAAAVADCTAQQPNPTQPNPTQPNQQAASAASAELPASSSAAAPECDLFGEPVELEQPADPQWTFPVVRQAHDPPAATSWQLPASKLAEYEAAYGDHLDVRLELIRARQWLIDHPKRRKTRGGMPAYLTKWLNSAVNRGPGGGSIRPRARRTALPA